MNDRAFLELFMAPLLDLIDLVIAINRAGR
jgi:hypothetical protein